MKRIVVVGASAAGLAAAETLRREGYDGTLTLVGAEPHPPYDRPPLSKHALSGEWDAGMTALRTQEDLAALGLDLRLGVAATGLDPATRVVRLADGSTVPYDRLVIATGVRPRRLPGDRDAHVLRTLDDALALRERLKPGSRLVVVGAGFLGAEAAAAACLPACRSHCWNRPRCRWPTRSASRWGRCFRRPTTTTVCTCAPGSP